MKKLISIFVSAYLCLISVSFGEETVYWDTFIKFENFLKGSDVICTGTVLKSVADNSETNKTTIKVEDIIKKSDKKELDSIYYS